MKIWTSKTETAAVKKIAADDMMLTKDMPTAAGSKMLDGYLSLLEAEALTRLKNAGYGICGKANVGEFAVDLMGETSCYGVPSADGVLKNAAAEIVQSGEAMAVVGLDVNGSIRRAAAQYGLVSVKPTYGTVSRYGTVPVACSGETVSVTAKNIADCREILDVLAGHDDKDGTSLSEAECEKIRQSAGCGETVRRVAVISEFTEGVDAKTAECLNAAKKALSENGIEVAEISEKTIAAARIAWNILMSAELCNNVSRYDGVKYGYRSADANTIDELYTNSRTEAFGDLLKTAILYGSDTLSTENYMKVYDKALRVRRLVSESFGKLFEQYDAVLMPACSKSAYSEDITASERDIAFTENLYTAPASITGLPTVTAGGVQLIGKAFSENALFEAAKLYE